MSTQTVSAGCLRPGRVRSRPDPHAVWLKQLSRMPQPPASFFPAQVDAWPMLGNDTVNCCTCAAAAHMIHAWSAARQQPVLIDEAHVLAAYIVVSQGSQGGAEMIDVLHYWRHNGISDRKLHNYVALDPHDENELRTAIYLFGSAYIGLGLPNFVMPGCAIPGVDWAIPASGTTGDAAPNAANGHCVAAIGYDQDRLHVVSCGSVRTMTWDFYRAYNEEAYAVLSPEWYGDEKRSPEGYNLSALEREISVLRHALALNTADASHQPAPA
jgi:hypothetical protein